MQQVNKEVVRRFFEAFSRHDIEEMKSLVAEDLVQHNSTSQGRDGLAEEARY
ncbi:MAG: nuclear transport factor 2 family protein, partial [Geminicoccales bacterium]